MTAYFGGRTEVRIRRTPIPVRYVDFASMYPTVFALLRLWDWVTAGRLATEDATDDARGLLATLDRAALHESAVWPRLAGVFCRIRPHGELLPVRAQYAGSLGVGGDEPTATGSAAWTIGLNSLVADTNLWFSLADLLVAKLLGGTGPEILEAFRVITVGVAADLRPIKLRGSIVVDPRVDDLFRLATEERARTKANNRLPAFERERLAQFLKTLANGGAYGIFAEVRQLDPVTGGTDVGVDGLWHIEARVSTPEEPGAYCFPPLAATVTAAARLLLALLQADVEARRGTYVTCDTDSLGILSSEAGGLVACPYGPERLPDGRPAIRTLSWDEVADVLAGLESLNPYASGTVKSLIKLEPENFALDDSGRPVELVAFAISAKRYVLYERHGDEIVIRKASWHGFGLYRSPLAKRGADEPRWEHAWPEWVDVVWRRFIAEVEGLPVGPEPDWFALPAVGQLPVSSPAVLRPFAALNAGKPYEQQVKPPRIPPARPRGCPGAAARRADGRHADGAVHLRPIEGALTAVAQPPRRATARSDDPAGRRARQGPPRDDRRHRPRLPAAPRGEERRRPRGPRAPGVGRRPPTTQGPGGRAAGPHRQREQPTRGRAGRADHRPRRRLHRVPRRAQGVGTAAAGAPPAARREGLAAPRGCVRTLGAGAPVRAERGQSASPDRPRKTSRCCSCYGVGSRSNS